MSMKMCFCSKMERKTGFSFAFCSLIRTFACNFERNVSKNKIKHE